MLRTQLEKVQGKFNVGGGEIDQDFYYNYFVYCLLAGLYFKQLDHLTLYRIIDFLLSQEQV